MPVSDEQRKREDLESQVWNAIAAFEQIVETIPDDRVSLEALSSAYEQVGDVARARDYLVRLVNVLVAEGDHEAAGQLPARLSKHAATDPMAKEAEARLEAMLAASKPAPDVSPEESEAVGKAALRQDEAELRGSHVAAELSFAWSLFQSEQLSQEEYAQVAQDLSEVSASSATVTVSVLHVLHDRTSRSLDRVIAFAAQDSGLPIIPLGLFDVPDTAFELLPVDFITRYGVMVFALLGNEALTVILNPQNLSLRARVERMVNRKCHFYLTTPADFDALLEKRKGPVTTGAPASGGAATP